MSSCGAENSFLCVSIRTQLSAGAGRSLGPQAPADSGGNFRGCLENLLYNGHNLIQLVRRRSPQAAAVVSPDHRRRSAGLVFEKVLQGLPTPSAACVRTGCRCNHQICPFIWRMFSLKRRVC